MKFFRFLFHVLADLRKLFVIYLPGETGVLLRRRYYSKRFRSCGRDLWVGTNVHISDPSMVVAGDNVRIRENVILHTGRNLGNDTRDVIELTPSAEHEKGLVILGDHSRIAFGAVILGYGGVRIGEKCGVGPGAIILSESFHHKGKDKNRIYKYSQGALPEEQCVVQGFVEFKDGAGIASNVIVLPGATIGKDAWVAPGSIVRVRGRVEDDVIAKGDPAVTIFKRPYMDESGAGE
jgi:acetyltransferase-like isoleucine patch superfamily enzyme